MKLLDRLRKSNVKEVDISKEDIEEVSSTRDVFDFLSGSRITKSVAIKIVALNCGINLITDSIANLPIFLYKRDKDGIKETIDDYRNDLLNLENEKHSTAFNMKKCLVTDYILHGNGYLDIWKENGKIKSLIHIPVNEISIQTNNSYNRRSIIYSYHYWGMRREFHEVLNLVRNPDIDAVEGVGILKEGSEMLRTAKNLDVYSKNVFENGFFAKGIVESDKVLTKPTRESLSNRIKNFFSGSKNAGKIMILDDGMKYKSLGLTPVDIDFLKQKDFTINDIARLLKLPPAMIGGSGNTMTYSNVQDTQLQYLQLAIEPYLTVIENTFNKYLLTEDEKKKGYFFEFDTKSILRTTPQKQIEMLGSAVNYKILTTNDARRELNYPALPNGDEIKYSNQKENNINEINLKGGEKSD